MMRAELFDRAYFEGDEQGRGYRYEGYRDFAVHHTIAAEILDREPDSVLEIGAARGYVAKILENHGVGVCAMDISPHCYHTRAVEDLILHDVTVTPYPEIPDHFFDLSVSVSVLEHIPIELVSDVIRELARVSSRGYHAISFASEDDDTHVTLRSREWWRAMFATCAPEYPVEIVDADAFGREPVTIPMGEKTVPMRVLKKIQFGSFTNMFYYGWENVDIDDLSDFAEVNGYRFLCHDVRTPLPYPDEYADYIFASHMLEHLDLDDALRFLAECRRILRPGGVLRIAVPDAAKLMEDYFMHRIREYACINPQVETARSDLEALQNLLYPGHRSVYDARTLGTLLQAARFKEIDLTTPFSSKSTILRQQTIVSHPTLSLVMEATK